MHIPMTTIEHLPGQAYEALGFLVEQELLGLSVARDLLAKIKEFFGGRVHSYDEPIQKGLRRCLDRLAARAAQAGGHAIIGLRLAITPVPFKHMTMMQVCIYGTAIRFLPSPTEPVP